MHELLTQQEMSQADRLTIENGPFSGIQLMENAGRAVAREVLAKLGPAPAIDILCGPGNNGGDGYVIAGELQRSGVIVSIYALAPPKAGTDAARAAIRCSIGVKPISDFSPTVNTPVVDALFGAGLERPLTGEALEAVEKTRASGCPVIAVDLPSGLSGNSGQVLGAACQADFTVTFFRKKPGHLLYPGRALCGELIVADIGIADDVLGNINSTGFENAPVLWRDFLPQTALDTHKYARGAVGVFSGGPSSTGAGRLAAMAAQRAGAGAVTVYSPANAVQVNACHLTSIMLARLDDTGELRDLAQQGRRQAYVLGPGFGVGQKIRDFAKELLSGSGETTSSGLVLDADGLTAFAAEPALLFDRADDGAALVLTPHQGEFSRLFSDLSSDCSLSKLDRARLASKRANAIVVYKGPDTVVAAPDGRAAINTNGLPWLATAGSGDVLAGVIAGLLAQAMPAFEATCAAAWLHGETGRLAGLGAIAEDFVRLLPRAFAEIG